MPMVINGRISYERILCPVDLAHDPSGALRYGAALAKAYDARLFVLYCKEAPPVAAVTSDRSIKKQVEDAVNENLFVSARGMFEWEAIVEEGDAADSITRVAAELRIDLIVMRSRRRPYAAALLGSTAESVCRTAPCPVLVTHPGQHDWVGTSTEDVSLNRVLVAYDYSSDSELALSSGLSFAQEYQSQLHLLHVLPPRLRRQEPEIEMLPFSAEIAFQEAPNRLRGAVPDEARSWCEVKQAVREGQPYREVLAYAEDQSIDLVCMGASGTGFGMRALFGSNADRVLRQAPCPVLIARPLRPMVSLPAAANA